MELIKLDGRMSGFPHFKYAASFVFGESDKFIDIREWCIEQWGLSLELDLWKFFNDRPLSTENQTNPVWCWERSTNGSRYKCKIYLLSDAEMIWFKLKWV